MFQNNLLMAAASIAGGGPATLTKGDYDEDCSPSGTNFTFSDMAIGDAFSDRIVFVIVTDDSMSYYRVYSGVTVGGVTATEAILGKTSNNENGVGIYAALVPTGTTADVVVSFASSTTCNMLGVTTLVSYGLSVTATDTLTGSAAVVSTGTIDCEANGVIVAGATYRSTNGAWIGITERTDESCTASRGHFAAGSYFTDAQSGLTVTCTGSGGTNNPQNSRMIAAAFGQA